MAEQTAQSLTQAVVTLPFKQADAVSDSLMELGALAVSLEDAHANTEEESPLFGEPGLEPQANAWDSHNVVALFRSEAEARQIFGEIEANQLLEQVPIFSQVPEQDWVRLTQSQFEPIEITPEFWIVPSWHEAKADPDCTNLILDPGLAFGTGSHPTTALCLRWLCENTPKGLSVLDYGCGSGILGIAALKLGASSAIGVDIDPQAVHSTEYNATRNGVKMPVGLPDFELATGQFPVVVANILSNPLKVLAPSLCAHVQPQGHIVLSGVLARQAEEVMACYEQWMNMEVWAEREGWVCLHGTPKA